MESKTMLTAIVEILTARQWRHPKRASMKKFPLSALVLVLVLSALLTACAAPGAAQKKQDAHKRVQTAQALFQERCKTAGEKIYQTADHVEGIFLMKLRPKQANFSDQYELDDPYGSDLGGDAYIQSFLRGSYQHQTTGAPAPGSPPRTGYSYVEALDPSDGKRYRYTGSVKAVGKMDATAPNVQIDLKRNPNFDLNIYSFVLDRTLATGPMPRYGVTYEDISTREEREYWIAGSVLKVMDLQTQKVMAERIGYMMDPGQGNTLGGRSPWLLAANHACPSFQRNALKASRQPGFASQAHQTQDFVEKVLKPKADK